MCVCSYEGCSARVEANLPRAEALASLPDADNSPKPVTKGDGGGGGNGGGGCGGGGAAAADGSLYADAAVALRDCKSAGTLFEGAS